ncbi:carbonic anhydrase [Microtetraspora sp. NBRC 13810]|uniref:beta-class carbonic anhydrase n=1 Tax=Microtetraspora sp. NBRC 13810 TaxID=3030990 RepID=UPI0024A5A219|nr:carbonic anhydrase [Microtetraspora sp. NBRC 13810]GLW07657.1 carbonic anhydrase [Microtetraspora sp. NBRC 13810]
MRVTDGLLVNAERFAAPREHRQVPGIPARRLVVLACMDARLNPYRLLGLAAGDAHILRNAGGVVTADVRRSIAISQRLLGTREIIVIQHTDCGMTTFTDDSLKRQIQNDTKLKPDWSTEAFTDLEENLVQSVGRIEVDPFIPHKDRIRAFIYEVENACLREVGG